MRLAWARAYTTFRSADPLQRAAFAHGCREAFSFTSRLARIVQRRFLSSLCRWATMARMDRRRGGRASAAPRAEGVRESVSRLLAARY
jgi:hypothetical protein